jgi:Dolichyl-phosphate-mannose-protein mannosyltransferase
MYTGFVNTMDNAITKKIFFTFFIIIYTVALFYLCWNINVETDELFTLDTTSKDISYAFKQSYYLEGQPPVYFILIALWRKISQDIFFVRLFSILSIGFATYIFYKVIQLISTRGCSRWLIIIFLLNPFTVWTALEARLYAFVLFLSLTSVYFFLRYYKDNKNKYLCYFILTGITGLYTQYLFIYLIASLGLALLIFRGWKHFFKYCLYVLPAALLFVNDILFVSNPLKLNYTDSLPTSGSEKLIEVFHSPQNLVLAMDMFPFERAIRWTILLVFIFVTIFSYLKWNKKSKSNDLANFEMFNIVLISAFGIVVFTAVLFAFTGMDYHDKYLGIAFPLFISVFLLFQMHSILNRNLIFTVISILYISLLIPHYKYPIKEYDTKGLVKYLYAIERKDEPICVYQKLIALPIKYYYNGKNDLVTLPDSLKFDPSYLEKLSDTVVLNKTMERISNTSHSLLLLTDRMDFKFKNDTDLKIFYGYMDKHFITTFDTVFYGQSKNWPLRVRRLEKK